MPKFQDLTGKRFTKLTVLERAESAYGKTRWLCACDCGKKTTTTAHRLLSGSTRSCGCFIPNRKYTHGLSKTRIYNIFMGMHRRCENKNEKSFERYGEKGITVCEEWNDFMKFYEWSMANNYNDSLSIDRIDNSLGYSPENCRWITMYEQASNKTSNIIISHNGESKTITQWSKTLGMKPSVALQRYRNASKKNISLSFDELFYSGNRRYRKIYQLDMDGSVIKEWPSISSAGKAGYEVTSIRRCCDGHRKSHKGYKWSYTESF